MISWLLPVLFLQTQATQSARPPAELFQNYSAARAATMRAGAPDADLDKLLAFYTDDVVYEDPAVHISIQGVAQIRDGMRSHLDDYQGSAAETSISIESSLAVGNAVAARVTETFWVRSGTARERIQRMRLQVAEFRGGKISRLIDYH